MLQEDSAAAFPCMGWCGTPALDACTRPGAQVTFKWTVWQRFLHIELACYLLWLFAFQTFVLIFQVIFPNPSLNLTPYHTARSTQARCSR
jgi:hypothetical protein